MSYMNTDLLEQARAQIRAQWGENRRITGDDYDKSLAVKCINGTFVGRKEDGIIAFKGIPFVGAQPVGQYRWKAPVDYVPDAGVYEAYYNGKSPCQAENISERGSLYVQGEDCLYLDIWKADEASDRKKPVMVWIHGGAFEMGGTVDPGGDCHSFVEENPEVIVVAIEYRLGVFGFFHLSHLPDGKDYPDAQNLGLMDQMMALKWVHENIAAFGGDPENVTIWGESAGAGSVTLLPLVKGSHAYFRRIIAESGSPVFTRSTEQAAGCTDEVMELLGCKTVAELLKLDARTLVQNSAVLALRVWAERDGNFLPLDPYEAYAKGAVADIDILQGCNKDEVGYFIFGFGLAYYTDWAAGRTARKLAQLTDREKALVQDYCKDVRGGDPGIYRHRPSVRPDRVPGPALPALGEPDPGRRQILHLFLHAGVQPAAPEKRTCGGALHRVQPSGGHPCHRKAVRPDLLQDLAQNVGAVCQDRQPVAQRRPVSRRQGQGMAAV